MEKLYYCFNKSMGVYVVEMKTWEKQKGTKEYWESFYGEFGNGFKLEEVEQPLTVQELIDELMKVEDKEIICSFLDDSFGLVNVGKVTVLDNDTEVDYGVREHDKQVVIER